MHQRLSNSSAKPASGPECSVPATGCAGTRCAYAGMCGRIAAMTAPLTEPTSETIAPFFNFGPISAATAPLAPTGTQTMTQSAPSAASALVSTTRSESFNSTTRLRVAAERAVATMIFAAPCARAARAIEEQIGRARTTASRSKIGAVPLATARPVEKLLERAHRELIRLLGAHAHAQRARQVIGLEPAQHQAALHEEVVGVLRCLPTLGGEVDKYEIRGAR